MDEKVKFLHSVLPVNETLFTVGRVVKDCETLLFSSFF